MKKTKTNKQKAHSHSFCINLNFSVVVTYNMFHSVVVLRTHAFLKAGKRVSRLMAWYTDQLGSLPEDTVSRRHLCVVALVRPARTGRDDTHTHTTLPHRPAKSSMSKRRCKLKEAETAPPGCLCALTAETQHQEPHL